MFLLTLVLSACSPDPAKDTSADTGGGDTAQDTDTDTVDTDTDTTDTDTDTVDTDTTDTDTDTTDTSVDTDTDTTDTDTGGDTGGGSVEVDCTGAGVAPAAGALVITEIMKNPNPTADETGEWVELTNVGSDTFDLCGLVLGDLGYDGYTLPRPFSVAPGDYVVLGASADTAVNGGLAVDVAYTYADFKLASSDPDEVVVFDATGAVLDQVAFDATNFPDTKGISMQLQVLDAVSNDDAANWCEGTSTYGTDGNIGTPGAANEPCAVVAE